MECYQRVSQPRQDAVIEENEVRINTQGLMRNYVSYASSLLQDRRVQQIVLKAMGRAISKAVMVAEIIKKRIEGLHQNITISSTDVTDVWEPLEEGLIPLEMIRHVSMITLTLSKKELDVSSSGYQPPLAVERVQPLAESNIDCGGTQGRGYGPGRGEMRGRGGNMTSGGGYYNAGDENWYRGRGRGVARGGGRGYRGGGRGYNNGGYYSGGYDNGGYKGGYNNGGYNNVGYNNGGYNYNNGGYNRGYNNGFAGRLNEGAYGVKDAGFRGRGRGPRGGRARGRSVRS